MSSLTSNSRLNTIGEPVVRSDGRAKVTGETQYSGDVQPSRLVYAALATSTISAGRITAMNVERANNMPGVLRVLTPFNAEKLPHAKAVEPPAQRMLTLLQDKTVAYNGQPVAVVIAQTHEQAQAAAAAIAISYERTESILDFKTALSDSYKPESMMGEEPDSSRGDAAAALRMAAHKFEATYTTSIEHHNPMEPHATVAFWAGEKLTVHDSTQYVDGVKNALAKIFGMTPDNVRVICRYTGGGFGCKGSMWSHVALAAMAARAVRRPVKLVLERTQMFGPVGARPRTHQQLRIGADERGLLQAVQHDVTANTSVFEDWTEPSAMVTRMLYACPNLATSHRLVKMNLGTPTFMRAPGEATGTFALEVALDEIAHARQVDPLELRIRNYAAIDPEKKLPFSSKSLHECYRAGANAFAWQRRQPKPRAMRDGNWMVGLGMATATYPMRRSQARAQAQLLPDGNILVRAGSQDLGTGTYTIMSQIAADTMQLPLARVQFELGDTRLPTAPVSGGSQTAASVGPAVQAAVMALRDTIIAAATADKRSPLAGAEKSDVECRDGWLIAQDRRESLTALAGRLPKDELIADGSAAPGNEREKYSMHSFGSVFAEVRVDEKLGIIQVMRIVGAYAAGKILNASTGRSQLLGGIVWGVGMALHEQSLLDENEGRFVNANLADYHVPINADIRDIEIIFVDEEDKIINSLGAKGIGELGITGTAAAISNAVFNATGRRQRDLPITPDKIVA